MAQRTGADDVWRQLFYDCRNTCFIGLVVLAISCDAFTRGFFKNEKFANRRRSEAILYCD